MYYQYLRLLTISVIYILTIDSHQYVILYQY